MTLWIRGTRDGSPGAVPRGFGAGYIRYSPSAWYAELDSGKYDPPVISPVCHYNCCNGLVLLVPSGLHTWITYQTHQPHQTALGRVGKPPGILYTISSGIIIIHIPPDSIPSGHPSAPCPILFYHILSRFLAMSPRWWNLGILKDTFLPFLVLVSTRNIQDGGVNGVLE